VAPAIEAAWQKVFAAVAIEDPAQLAKEGWRNSYEIAHGSHREKQAVERQLEIAVRKGEFEKKQAKVMRATKVQKINFYRPKPGNSGQQPRK
jgi:hypothetical protein